VNNPEKCVTVTNKARVGSRNPSGRRCGREKGNARITCRGTNGVMLTFRPTFGYEIKCNGVKLPDLVKTTARVEEFSELLLVVRCLPPYVSCSPCDGRLCTDLPVGAATAELIRGTFQRYVKAYFLNQ